MQTTAGLWIDHTKAVIVFVTGEEGEIKLISSNMESANRSGPHYKIGEWGKPGATKQLCTLPVIRPACRID